MKNRFSACTTVVIMASVGIASALTAHHGTKPNNAVSLKIATEAKTVVSGYPCSLHVSVIDRSGLTLWFVNPDGPAQFFAASVTPRSKRSGAVLTRYGQDTIGALLPAGGPIRPAHTVAPGASERWEVPFPLARLYDLTVPEKYRIRLITERPIY